MKVFDAIEMGVYNLRRAILRTILTTLGVIIGIGTLSSMISFGAGMEANITKVFKDNDLFTSLFVTSKEINIDAARQGDMNETMKGLTKQSVPLNDSSLSIIKNIEHVDIAFPEISFPVQLKIDTMDLKTNVYALPPEMKNYPPYDDIKYGSFINGSSNQIVISQKLLGRMGIFLKKDNKLDTNSNGNKFIKPDELIGKEIELITAANNEESKGLLNILGNTSSSGIIQNTQKFKIVGIFIRNDNFQSSSVGGDAIISIKSAEKIPRVNFSSVWDLLGNSDNDRNKYNSIYVRTNDVKNIQIVSDKLKEAGFNVFSLADKFDEIKKRFLIIDGILGAIGIVALFVAGLGIINIMTMSILERKKEIGIMKAIGGGEKDIRLIFFVEASIIGFLGGLLGLILGWGVTEAANLIINNYMIEDTVSKINLFSFPIWLILGSMGFSILISLFAGLYPAYRAARIDPVDALRHE